MIMESLKRNFKANLLLVALVFFALAISAQEYPVNFDKNGLKEFKDGNDYWNFRTTALEGSIQSIHSQPDKNIFILLDMEGNDVWLNLSHQMDEMNLKEGDQIKALGFLKHGDGHGRGQNQHNNTGFYLLTFGILNLQTMELTCLESNTHFCDQWKYNGELPEVLP